MSNRSAARQSRAEARRRARLAAQGQTGDLEGEENEADQAPPAPAAAGGFLQRLVPPAPPLPGKGDPLAGFTYTGPVVPLVSSLWLLLRNPISWLVPALIWMVAWPFSLGGGTNALIGSVAQYVASLPVRTAPTTLQGGNATAGAASYGGVCTVCHGADGMGNEAMGAPPLVHESDWYILRALDKFKSHVRGYDSTDAQGQQMATMSSTLQDHQAMLDVIAYIRTLPK